MNPFSFVSRIAFCVLAFVFFIVVGSRADDLDLTWVPFVVDGAIDVFVGKGDIGRVYSLRADGRLAVNAEWKDFHHFFWWSDPTTGQYHALITYSNHAEMVRMGQWNTPVLTEKSGMPLDFGIPTRLNLDATKSWRGFAVPEFTSSGSTKEVDWAFFVADDGSNWHRANPPIARTTGYKLLRVGQSEFAVGSQDNGWDIWTRDHSQWTSAALPSKPATIRSIWTQHEGIIGVCESACNDEPGREANGIWYAQGPNRDEWRFIKDTFEAAPGYIKSASSWGNCDFIELRGKNRLEDETEVKVFYSKGKDAWIPIEQLISVGNRRVDDLTLYARGQIMGVRLEPSPDFAKDWLYFFKAVGEQWKPLEEINSSTQGTPWRVRDIADGTGVEVEFIDPRRDQKNHFHYTYFLRTPQGMWSPAGEMLPIESSFDTSPEVDTDLSRGIFFSKKEASREKEECRLSIRRSNGHWDEWSPPGGVGIVRIEPKWESGVIRVIDDHNREFMFAQNGTPPTWNQLDRSPITDFEETVVVRH